ncbi:hypothetical protein FJZ33_11800, partial [Candidatus Poribacteria bacterium]|nr:hypothetical protein [Candidatus Poribacteria bacterium]
MSRRIVIIVLFCLLTSMLLAMSVDATTVKTSQLKGGRQYWWEAEDFNSRDATIMLLKGDAGNPLPNLPGAFGNNYIVHKSA